MKLGKFIEGFPALLYILAIIFPSDYHNNKAYLSVFVAHSVILPDTHEAETMDCSPSKSVISVSSCTSRNKASSDGGYDSGEANISKPTEPKTMIHPKSLLQKFPCPASNSAEVILPCRLHQEKDFELSTGNEAESHIFESTKWKPPFIWEVWHKQAYVCPLK